VFVKSYEKIKNTFYLRCFLLGKMNRKDDYDSYEIEEPSDEEGAQSRYVTENINLNISCV